MHMEKKLKLLCHAFEKKIFRFIEFAKDVSVWMGTSETAHNTILFSICSGIER